MIRSVQPEILDILDTKESQAIRSRRDLQHINYWMGNYQWVSKSLKRNHNHVRKDLIEVGALGSPLPQNLKCSKSDGEWHYTALDRLPEPAGFPESCRWIQKPVESYEGWNLHNTFVSNFLLHQLETQVLKELGLRMANHLELIVCNEPYRHRLFLLAAKPLFRLFGYSKTTRHDGLVSIRAGFKLGELPAMLGLQERDWTVSESVTFLGSYRMVAKRKT